MPEDDDEDGGDENDKDEKQDTPGLLDYVMHGLTLPWKVFFALIPPTDYCGGWLCFCVALVFIGVLTAVIGDLAGSFGCQLGFSPMFTGITFVALGTSLPDTFASKTAAVQDEYADASIGNVTGSNSVNVFLGLGVPHFFGSLYWETKSEPTADWPEAYGPSGSKLPEGYSPYFGLPEGNSYFIVPKGSLVFSVIVFSTC